MYEHAMHKKYNNIKFKSVPNVKYSVSFEKYILIKKIKKLNKLRDQINMILVLLMTKSNFVMLECSIKNTNQWLY